MFTQLILCLLLSTASAHLPVPEGAGIDCGRQDIREFHVDGETVTSEQPWFIVVYLNRNAASTNWFDRTTGTLISTRHVVTEALGVTECNGTPLPATLLRITAGKHLQGFHVTEPNSQTRDVMSVRVHEEYNVTNRANDIALLVAAQPFALTWDVNIACVDYSGLLQAPTPGQRVLAEYWRRGVNTSSLVFTSQPAVIIPQEQCRSSGLESARPFLTANDLCVRTTSNIACGSVSGKGLFVQRTTSRGARFFMVGVWKSDLGMTPDGRCHKNLLSAFTTVTSFTSWLKRNMT